MAGIYNYTVHVQCSALKEKMCLMRNNWDMLYYFVYLRRVMLIAKPSMWL